MDNLPPDLLLMSLLANNGNLGRGLLDAHRANTLAKQQSMQQRLQQLKLQQ